MGSVLSTALITQKLLAPTPGGQINSQDIQIIQKLNSGCSSTVYYGLWNDTEVAIKELKEDADDQYYQNEKSILHTLTCVNQEDAYIVKYYGFIEDGIKRSIVMEYMHGGDLIDYINKCSEPALPEQRILQFALEIADGLECLHYYEIIHCDVKCENILLDQDEHAKLSDFGFSKYKKDIKNYHSLNGTPVYIAPELVAPFTSYYPYSEKSDMYSYSMVLYVLTHFEITYDLLNYKSLSEDSILALTYGNDRPVISDQCPRFFAALITRCWEQNPDQRPSAYEVIDEIENKMKM